MTAVARPLPTHGTTDATGTRRRIQALHHNGYDNHRIAEAIGRPAGTVKTWLHNNRGISARNAEAVTDLYQCWSGIPAETNGSSQDAADAARALARRRRWYPAACWAGEDMDDPAAAPVSARTSWRSEDLVAEAEQVRAATDYKWAEIAAHLGVTFRALDRARTRVAARRRAVAAP